MDTGDLDGPVIEFIMEEATEQEYALMSAYLSGRIHVYDEVEAEESPDEEELLEKFKKDVLME